MPKIKYETWKPKKDTLALIEQANVILNSFNKRGFTLSVRQLYYQLVSQNVIRNSVQPYNRLSETVRKARVGGMIDWSHIQDRGRFVREKRRWFDGADALRELSQTFNFDMWTGQRWRVEVWVEKDALVDVVGQIATAYDVPHTSCRGFASASAVWEAAHSRFLRFTGTQHTDPKAATESIPSFMILHLSDHDPSGLAMTTDLRERMQLFSNPYGYLQRPFIQVRRVALNLDQIKKYKLPPNPAKESDPRFAKYEEIYGDESWELDALDPSIIMSLIEDEIKKIIDMDLYEDLKEQRDNSRERFRHLTLQWGS